LPLGRYTATSKVSSPMIPYRPESWGPATTLIVQSLAKVYLALVPPFITWSENVRSEKIMVGRWWWTERIVAWNGGECESLPHIGQPIRAAIRRSRFLMLSVWMNHTSRRVPFMVAPRTPSRSRSTIMAWMVPLCLLGSNPMPLTRSEQVCGPCWIRAERIAVRVMVVKSIGRWWWTDTSIAPAVPLFHPGCATLRTVCWGGLMGHWML